MLAGRAALNGNVVAELHWRQRLLFFERLAALTLLARFAIDLLISFELHDAARRTEQVWKSDLLEIEIDSGRIESSGRHLRCDEALPDQLIQLELVGLEIFDYVLGAAGGVSWTNRFVRILCIAGFPIAIELYGCRLEL